MIALAIARHLDTLGLVTFNQTGSGGDCFVGDMPSAPDAAVAVMPAPPSPQMTLAPTDLPSVQILVRGERYELVDVWARARGIYSALTGMDHTLLDAGGSAEVLVIGSTAVQSGPVWIGRDANERHELSLNLNLRVHAPTIHRPALTP